MRRRFRRLIHIQWMYGDDERGRKGIGVLNSIGWYVAAYDYVGGGMSRMPVQVCVFGGLTGEVSCHEGAILICS
jgi:hypothetical protein